MTDDLSRGTEFVAAPPRIAPGVASMVGYRALDVPESIHRGMPSAWLTFIVSLDDGVRAAPTAEALETATPNPLVLGGLHMSAAYVRQHHAQAGVQLAVHPLASRALFGVPSAELSLTDFAAVDVLGVEAAALPERTAANRRWPDIFATVADYLTTARRHRDVEAVRPEVALAWHLLERSQGRIPVGALANRTGISSRHLTTLFRREVGRSPKEVAMLMRFHHATTAIARSVRDGRVNLAAIATTTGYSDQAHLTREFVRFAGNSPSAWLAEEFRNIQDGGHANGAQSHYDQ